MARLPDTGDAIEGSFFVANATAPDRDVFVPTDLTIAVARIQTGEPAVIVELEGHANDAPDDASEARTVVFPVDLFDQLIMLGLAQVAIARRAT